MTHTTFYPDKNPESTSVDGNAECADSDGTWAAKRGEAGSSANDSGATMGVLMGLSSVGSDAWRNIRRVIVLFNISSLGGDTVSAVTFGVVANDKDDDFTDGIAVVSSAPASNTALAAGDYDSLGTTRYATDITIANITNDDSTYSTWTFSATGVSAVDGASGGIVKLGMRTTFDYEDSEPSKAGNFRSFVQMHTADESDSGEKRPTLTVTHVTAFTPRAIMF
jgi:hypothetical protein